MANRRADRFLLIQRYGRSGVSTRVVDAKTEQAASMISDVLYGPGPVVADQFPTESQAATSGINRVISSLEYMLESIECLKVAYPTEFKKCSTRLVESITRLKKLVKS